MAKVLVIGSGGREHALAWKLARSADVSKVLVCPGNGGTSQLTAGKDAFAQKISNTVEAPCGDFKNLSEWCKSSDIDLVVVGPEVPLADGIADVLSANGVDCFGPSKKAALLEASKDFSKNFMVKHSIPTARFSSFTSSADAEKFIASAEYEPLVVKASGLAAGKGVIVCGTRDEARNAAREILDDNKFGISGGVVVVEELLKGEEFSVLCFSDGKNIAMMPPTQDHKRAFDGDLGPNTGGMGAYGPCDQLDQNALEFIRRDVLQKAIDGASEDGHPFVGVLYAGVMMTVDGPKVLEFNCRFGDPECQVLMSLLDSDLYTIMKQCCHGGLVSGNVLWKTDVSATCVVLASGGYPGKYEKNKTICGIDACNQLAGVQVFEAGTAVVGEAKVTSGGRVLSVTSVAESLEKSVDVSMRGCSLISFEGMFHRRDIAKRGIAYNASKPKLTYASCGVDIGQGDAFVQKISPLAAATSRPGCDASLGGFGAVFDLKAAGYSNPVLVSGTDGVGTKLLLAQEAKLFSTLGQDLLAMCVNDILTHNAEPLFFLDYFSCGRLDEATAAQILKGVSDACKACDCALAGGETAEMPGLYPSGEFDLAGFAVGAYDKGRHRPLPLTDSIIENDVVIGISSTGIHSNGFSLVRQVVKLSRLSLNSKCPFDDERTLVEALLTPTALYSRPILSVIRNNEGVKAAAHITGGGLPGNLSRVLPVHLRAVLDAEKWDMHPVFGWIAKTGNVSPVEMYRTFNCGLGLCLVVDRENHVKVLEECNKDLQGTGLEAYLVGRIEPMNVNTSDKVVVRNFKPVLEKSWTPISTNGCSNGIIPNINAAEKPKVAVLISGTGTNLQALIDHEKSGKANYVIALVLSNKNSAAGLDKAKAAGIPTVVVVSKKAFSREEYDQQVHRTLLENGIQLVCLAGFMRLLSGWFTRTWQGRVLNIHPSLLPSFRGMDAHRQVLDAGVKVTGCTVHFVTEKMDDGAIISQTAVNVEDDDDVESLSERVKGYEHKTYPAALDLVAKRKVGLDSSCNRVIRQ